MRTSRWWRVAALGMALVLPAACGGGSDSGDKAGAAWHSGQPSAGPAAGSPASASPSVPAGKPVHVRLFQGDGSTWGVGMPIIAYLSAKITDAQEFAAGTAVTVDGAPAQGAWYFERSAIYKGYPLEAHYRTEKYWPAHAKVHMDLAAQGKPAGPDLVFDNSLTLDMNTGAANISRIDGKAERMIVTSDGKQVFSFHTGAYHSVISDGRRLYLTGYSSINALQPKKKGQKGGEKQGAPKQQSKKG